MISTRLVLNSYIGSPGLIYQNMPGQEESDEGEEDFSDDASFASVDDLDGTSRKIQSH